MRNNRTSQSHTNDQTARRKFLRDHWFALCTFEYNQSLAVGEKFREPYGWRINLLLRLGLWGEYRDHYHGEDLAYYRRKTTWYLVRILSYFSLPLAVFWTLLSYSWDASCCAGDQWFQRSGAILVFSATLTEVPLPMFDGRSHYFGPSKSLGKTGYWVRVVSLILIPIGTVIWAYGDWWVC